MRKSIALPLAALLALSFAAPARAADVDVDLIAASFEFHENTPSAPSDPTITVTVGDVIRFRVENQDAFLHTFTVPHFNVTRTLASAGSVVFVNITTTSADAGRWQFWCDPHSSGATPETHSGMIGFIQVNAPATPRQPGFEAFLAILAAGTAFAILAVRRDRKRS